MVFVPKEMINSIDYNLNEYKLQFQDAVEKFKFAYPFLRDHAIVHLGELFNESDYPVDISSRFSFTWRFLTLNVPNGNTRLLAPEVYEREKQKFVETMEEARQMAITALRVEFTEHVKNLTDRLRTNTDGKPRIFKNGTVNNFYDFFETFKQRNIFEDQDLKELVTQAQTVLSNHTAVRFTKGNDYNSLLEMGIALLTAWYDSRPGEAYRLLAVEEPFKFTVPGVPVPIIGGMDLVEEDPSGTIIITDHKTPAKAMPEKDVHINQQLTIYQMAAKANGYANREIMLKFDCLIKTKTPKFLQYYTTRSQNEEQRMIRKIQSVWEGIVKGVFVPNDLSWKCNNCSYTSACNEWFQQEAA